MRNVFVTLRLGADARARFDVDTQELYLVTDTGGEFCATIIPLDAVEHVLTQISQAWETGRIALAQRQSEQVAAWPSPPSPERPEPPDNVTPFKRPEGGA